MPQPGFYSLFKTKQNGVLKNEYPIKFFNESAGTGSTMNTKAQTVLEVRALHELRSVGDDGIFEGYIAVWDTVDSYDSEFMRGSFKKTIEDRGSKIKVFYDHDVLVGKSLEIREDDHGVFVRGKLSLKVQKAQEVMEFIKDGTLTTLSFGFRTIKDKFINGIRKITEVKLYEYGPVVFEANENATITDIRAQKILNMNKSKEERATEFARSKELDDLASDGRRIFNALDTTIWDIWYSGTAETIPDMMRKAIDEFRDAHVKWVEDYIAEFWESETRSVPFANELATEFAGYLETETRTIDTMAMETIFTHDELRSLERGTPIINRDKLSTLPESIREAHNTVRNKAVNTLFSELRAGLSSAENTRIVSILTQAENDSLDVDSLQGAVNDMKEFRKTLNLNDGEK